ncbi:unnamed protein product [Merluccius merluccius]
MDALKSAGRAIIKSPGVPRHTWGTSKHEKLPENWTDTKETLLEGMVFNVKYLGMTLVGQPKGEDMAAAAIRRIVATARASAKKFRKVTLTVSPKGIVLSDTETTDLIEDVSIYSPRSLGVGVPLMLTYVYGVVPMSLCRNGWCRPQGEPPDSHKIQLEDLASFSDHWTGQNSPANLSNTNVQEVKVSVQEVGVLPSTSTAAVPEVSTTCTALEEASESPGYMQQQDSQSDCEVVIVPDGKLSDTQAFSLRDGTSIKVRVEIETHPRGARQTSLSSVLSSHSLSVESLGHSWPQSLSQDYLCASESADKRGGRGGSGGGSGGGGSGGGGSVGGGAGGDDKLETGEAEGTFCPVFEFEGM